MSKLKKVSQETIETWLLKNKETKFHASDSSKNMKHGSGNIVLLLSCFYNRIYPATFTVQKILVLMVRPLSIW